LKLLFKINEQFLKEIKNSFIGKRTHKLESKQTNLHQKTRTSHMQLT
jgi:hypothetical protein